jgi:hypothetical integral membrane protein (TIGR02206 family)
VFSTVHLAILAAIIAAAAGLGRWIHRRPKAVRPVRLALAAALAANELAWWVARYAREGLHASYNLPLQLSDLVFWMAVFTLFTCKQWPYDFIYYVGLPTAAMAVLTPDLWGPLRSFASISFFVAHGGTIVTVLMLLWGGVMKPRPPGWRRVWMPLLAWTVLAGAADWAFGANYMYLRAKPRAFSILNWFGPWPAYIGVAAALAWVIFRLLWLPVRPGVRAGGVNIR